jgi:hypothetical protein
MKKEHYVCLHMHLTRTSNYLELKYEISETGFLLCHTLLSKPLKCTFILIEAFSNAQHKT